jgi:hypothetical protein
MRSAKQCIVSLGRIPLPGGESERPWRGLFHLRLPHLRVAAKYSPLIVSILAPLSTLLYIPSLAVRSRLPLPRSSCLRLSLEPAAG